MQKTWEEFGDFFFHPGLLFRILWLPLFVEEMAKTTPPLLWLTKYKQKNDTQFIITEVEL